MPKVNNHYVPQFHLRNFSNNRKSIGMFVNKKKLYIKQASIKEQAFKKYLYGEDEVLENYLMDIETILAKIIRQIILTSKLPEYNSEEYQLLLLYLLFSEARVQKAADSQDNFLDTQMKVLAKMDKNLKIPHDIMDKVKISYNIPNLLPLQVAAKIFPILLDLKTILIISDSDRMFVTSDNPLTRYNLMYVKRNYQLRGYGLGNMGIQLFYPISPKIFICIYDDVVYQCNGLRNQIVRISKGTYIDELNKLFYQNSMDYLFFNEKVTESYIKRITEGLSPINDIKKEISIFGAENEKLIHFQNSFVKEKVKIPFMSMYPKIMNMPLPTHMAGPMRPNGIRFQNKIDIN